MIDNFPLYEELLQRNLVEIEPADFLYSSPSCLPTGMDFDRVAGMMLGLAIGDALGNTTESMLPANRRQQFGEIRDYLPNKYAGYRNEGLPSDDSQMAFWTLEQLAIDGGLIPENLANVFSQKKIFGIGKTVKDFIYSYHYQGKTWFTAGQPSAGNGSLMRIAPMLIPHLRQPSSGLWMDTILSGMITHNDRAANASNVAYINILWECLKLIRPPDAVWWVEAFTAVAKQLEGNTAYLPRHDGVLHSGPLWQFIDREVHQELRDSRPTLDACERWHSGAYLLETIPCVLYILARHGNDPEQAIIRAVNDTKDNDTIAAIVGAAVGALHGKTAFPKRWLDGLSGRTEADDDGHIFDVIEEAKRVFWQEYYS